MNVDQDPNRGCVYTVRKTHETPALDGPFDGGAWKDAAELRVDHFHARSSDHRPKVLVKLLYDGQAVYVQFRVHDRYVVCVHTQYQAPVCRDSCVEFFAQPKRDKGYFNFELNCGGYLLLSYVEDPARTPDGFKKYTRVPWEEAKSIRIHHSMSGRVFPEIQQETEWSVAYAVPFALFEHYVGHLGNVTGQEWRANVYKCADDSSRPHWAAWAPIGEDLNFHQPRFFGLLHFA